MNTENHPRRGRPSDYSADIAMTICDRLADGRRHVLSRIFGRDTGNRQQHMGRSCGGLTSKIQAVVYTNSLPVHLGLTPGDTRENLSGTTDSFVKLPVCRKLP